MNHRHSGLLAAIAAFSLWGILPIYWKLIEFIPPFTIAAQRTVWSLVILLVILMFTKESRTLIKSLRDPRITGWLLVSGSLLAINWVLYIWATLNDRMIEGALGYYLNPFFNMLFGVIWFGERHNRAQIIAIALAIAGVLLQFPAVGQFPWVALTLAITFSLYGVVKKRAPLGSRLGLTAETTLLAPIALGWLLLYSGSPAEAFGGTWPRALMVAGCGLATTMPLVLFGYAARNIRLSTLGIVQFIGPTTQFFIGWKMYDEPMSTGRLLSFALIWTAIGIYAVDGARKRPVKLV